MTLIQAKQEDWVDRFPVNIPGGTPGLKVNQLLEPHNHRDEEPLVRS